MNRKERTAEYWQERADWCGVSTRTVRRWAGMPGFPADAGREELVAWVVAQADIRAPNLVQSDDDESDDDDDDSAWDADLPPKVKMEIAELRKIKLLREIARLDTQIGENKEALARKAVEDVADHIAEILNRVRRAIEACKLPLADVITINDVIDTSVNELRTCSKQFD